MGVPDCAGKGHCLRKGFPFVPHGHHLPGIEETCMVGIEHITEYLKTGDRIRVDGDAGTVTVLPDCSETTEG